ncbi:SIR2 family protein [Secundilactobacillus kimchicus]|uniref:SIR2 family protein n=1 Tax=Secundilactobacillus kimchicus TaxID=528209 RepID=UPI0024A92840|nr:SIR2 family protein [Secundilactobacillus kimchicus]
MGLKEIVQENHYPIVFIGSGIEKRYLKNFPNWNSLLKGYWDQINETQNFYSFLRTLTKKHPDSNTTDQDFYANVEAATYIQEKFDDLFYDEQIKVSGLSIQQAQQNRISPFKQSISNRLKHYELSDSIDADELANFVQMLEKAKMIITTNYDTFIQDQIEANSDQRPSVFVGRSGLFDSNEGWSEIYQIHGSVTDSNSIVINSKDYDNFDENSVLVSAKIMSSMIDTPIIFFGYSMTDRNIRKVLDDFGTQLPQEDPRKSANRILIVDYEAGQNEIVEQIVQDPSLHQLTYTLIKTDNYKAIFNQLKTINEGATPYEVKKFNGLIKKLIVQQGQMGKLDAVLVTPTQLDDISKEIDQGKPIVVALGNERYFYVYPDLVSYMKDYFNNTDNYLPAVALSFAAHDGNRLTKTPFSKYLHAIDVKTLKLPENDLEKLRNKIDTCSTLDELISGLDKYSQNTFYHIADVKKQHYSLSRTINVITFNLRNIPLEELKEYVLKEVLPLFETVKSNVRTNIRKLLFGYDLLLNGDLKQIKNQLITQRVELARR